jgi:hypothetical protein
MPKTAIGNNPKPVLHKWSSTNGFSSNWYWLAHTHTKCPSLFFCDPIPTFLHVRKEFWNHSLVTNALRILNTKLYLRPQEKLKEFNRYLESFAIREWEVHNWVYVLMVNSMEHSRSWEASSRSFGQEIARFYGTRKLFFGFTKTAIGPYPELDMATPHCHILFVQNLFLAYFPYFEKI